MSEERKIDVGRITWTDLTVENADEIKQFYSDVVGWRHEPVDMGEYHDYNMRLPSSEKSVAGICHARGMNADLPAQWLIYITVESVDNSAAQCAKSGGIVLVEPRRMGEYGRYCVIQDPAGAVAALFEPNI